MEPKKPELTETESWTVVARAAGWPGEGGEVPVTGRSSQAGAG